MVAARLTTAYGMIKILGKKIFVLDTEKASTATRTSDEPYFVGDDTLQLTSFEAKTMLKL